MHKYGCQIVSRHGNALNKCWSVGWSSPLSLWLDPISIRSIHPKIVVPNIVRHSAHYLNGFCRHKTKKRK